ncbi:AraC family transcriptional regulator [Pontiella sulfatireligans]|uniref:Xylose operon regulatory protein n=1 Tax=Pontiella sulfatireligans TaxID=2750658 RepID=A0A6C2UJI4_9BACT|nr:DNA-binding transcriptional regulator [Pontiella sulfatireligans]VGO20380.1 Xylose operon regulatory protein [Pontiella sulfatireligans]
MKDASIPQVAILISTTRNWGRLIVKGILAYAHEVGPWHLWIKPSSPDIFDAMPKGWKGDGVIARVSSTSLAGELTASGLPVVNVADTPTEGFSAPCVRTDDRIGTKMAAEHFIERGFRTVAYVGSQHTPNPIWYGQAFKEALAEHDIPCSEYYFSQNDPSPMPRLTEWLLALPKPVGILVWGHGNGRTVVDCCMEAGISVPHDVAVLGGSYDELMSHACFPTLSGLHAPTEQIGYEAAKLLHRMMQGGKVPRDTIYIPPLGIVERLSTDTLAVKDPKLVQVVQFIRDHAFESITMTDILRAVPMARRSLDRQFFQTFGRSPRDEIRRLRINKARQLLAETDLSMQLIAEACGYATYNYLTHAFKQATHMTPRDYRRKMRTG